MTGSSEKTENSSSASDHGIPETRYWGYVVGRGLNYPRLNRDFTAACFALPPLLGSAASVIFHGGALWCIAAIASGNRPLVRDRHVLQVTAACWLFVFAYVLSGLLNGTLLRTPSETVWLWTFFVFPFSYSIWSISDKAAVVAACVGASVVASYGAMLLAGVQFALLGLRPEGGAGNAIVFATVTTLAGAIALAGAFATSGRKSRVALGAFVASVLAVSLSETRGIWPAIAINVVLLVVLYRARLKLRLTWFAAVSVAGFIAILAGLALFVVPRMEAAIADLVTASNGDFDTSIGQRLIMWAESMRIWKESPLYGFGAGSVPELLSARVRSAYGLDLQYSHAHNAFLTTLVESGVIGFTGLLGMIIIPLNIAWIAIRRRPNADERFGVALIVVLMSTFVTAGVSSIMIGHDILDTTFVMSLVLGLYLAQGTPGGEAAIKTS